MAVSPRYEAGEMIEEFFREHRAKVLAICRSLLNDPGEAEDASQQVFLAAFRALAGGTVPRKPGVWLAAIARNECRARAQSTTPIATTTEELESPGADPAALVVRRAEVAAVWEAVEGLPPSQREAFLLREVRGLSYTELADNLQLTHPSIRSLLARARQAIRLRLGVGAAAFGGVSWLESLARLLAGGSTPAAIATKTAAVGLGAAAITGGAIVAPDLAGHQHTPRAAVIASLRRHPVVARVHPKPVDPVDRVTRALKPPSAPTRLAAAPELAIEKPVVHHGRRETEPSAARIKRPTLSIEHAHPSAAAGTFVADQEGDQNRVAPRPASPSAASPSAQRTDGDGESGHDSGSGVNLGEAEAAASPTVITPSVRAGQTTRHAESISVDDGGASGESRSSGLSDPGVQPAAPVADGSRESSDTSPQVASDGSQQPSGSDKSAGD